MNSQVREFQRLEEAVNEHAQFIGRVKRQIDVLNLPSRSIVTTEQQIRAYRTIIESMLSETVAHGKVRDETLRNAAKTLFDFRGCR